MRHILFLCQPLWIATLPCMFCNATAWMRSDTFWSKSFLRRTGPPVELTLAPWSGSGWERGGCTTKKSMKGSFLVRWFTFGSVGKSICFCFLVIENFNWSLSMDVEVDHLANCSGWFVASEFLTWTINFGSITGIYIRILGWTFKPSIFVLHLPIFPCWKPGFAVSGSDSDWLAHLDPAIAHLTEFVHDGKANGRG